MSYGQDPTDALTWGRVILERVGNSSGTVGGTYKYEYSLLGGSVPTTTVFDRNDNCTVYHFLVNGMLSDVHVQLNRTKAGSGEYVTEFNYNARNQVTQILFPNGNYVTYTYDDGVVDADDPVLNPYIPRRGLLLSQTRYAGATPSSGQSQLTESYFYEPIYNQRCATIEARGNPIDADGHYFTPQNGGTAPTDSDRSRYTTLTYSDYQKDDCDTVTGDHALLALLGLTSADQIEELLNYVNGQMVGGGIPGGFEPNGTSTSGLGDINGDGTGDGASSGLPSATHLGNVVKVQHPAVTQAGDESPTQSRIELFTNNAVGQMTTCTDPEGNLTVYVRYPFSDPDGSGQDVEQSLSVPTLWGQQYGQMKEVHVDADPNDVMTLVGGSGDLLDFTAAVTPIIDRNNTPDEYQDLTTRYEGSGVEGGGGCASCAYDAMGNPLAVTDPRGFTTRYDRNELGDVYRTTAPAPYNFHIETYYDANRNVTRVDTEDLQPAYDSADPTSACYAQFTPSGSGTAALVPMKFGPGGASRPGWFTNLYEYDVLDNKIEQDIDATGSTPSSLVTRYAYDPNQNLIQITKPEGNLAEYDYEERDLRIAERIGYVPGSSGVGNPASVTIFTYDGNSNLIQIIGPAQRGASGNEQSVTINDFFRSAQTVTHTGDWLVQNVYDGFNRVILVTDSLGNTIDTGSDLDVSGDPLPIRS